MEDFEKKVSITEPMEAEDTEGCPNSSKILHLLRRFLAIQQRRAEAYAKLKKYVSFSPLILFLSYQNLGSDCLIFFVHVDNACLIIGSGFAEYMDSGGELAYQQLCSEITVEFNDCSKQVFVSFPFSVHIIITTNKLIFRLIFRF